MVREYFGRRGLIVGCASDGALSMKDVSIAYMLLDAFLKIRLYRCGTRRVTEQAGKVKSLASKAAFRLAYTAVISFIA